MKDIRSSDGKILLLQLLWYKLFVFNDTLQRLLTSTTETVKSVDYDQLVPWLGTGLLISNGKVYKIFRIY